MVTNNNYSLENFGRPEDRQKSRIGAGIFLALLLLFLLWPWYTITYPLPEPPGLIADFGEEGRMASLGNVAVAGGGEERPNEKPPVEEEEPEPEEEEPEPVTEEEVETTNDNQATKINTSEEQPKTNTSSSSSINSSKPTVNNQAIFGGGTGTGKGSGKQGRPDGKGDLGGTGRGKNGFGEDALGSRELLQKCNNYKTGSASWSESGKAVFKICVDERGKVISSMFVRKGSTITSEKLVEFIRGCSLQYEYESKIGAATQCGNITIKLGLN